MDCPNTQTDEYVCGFVEALASLGERGCDAAIVNILAESGITAERALSAGVKPESIRVLADIGASI
jgi:hypothetical protein